MDVLWMCYCYGCVMDVLWMCYVVCDITVMLIFVFCFSGLFKMTIKP